MDALTCSVTWHHVRVMPEYGIPPVYESFDVACTIDRLQNYINYTRYALWHLK